MCFKVKKKHTHTHTEDDDETKYNIFYSNSKAKIIIESVINILNTKRTRSSKKMFD